MSAYYDLYRKSDKALNEMDGKCEYYARPVDTTTYSTEDAIKAIQEKCTLNSADLKAVLRALSDYMAKVLKQGDHVHLEGIGTFHVSLTCRKTDKLKPDHTDVRFGQINYIAETALNRQLKTMQLAKLPKHESHKVNELEERKVLAQKMLSHKAFFTILQYIAQTGVSRYQADKDLSSWIAERLLAVVYVNKTKTFVKPSANTRIDE